MVNFVLLVCFYHNEVVITTYIFLFFLFFLSLSSLWPISYSCRLEWNMYVCMYVCTQTGRLKFQNLILAEISWIFMSQFLVHIPRFVTIPKLHLTDVLAVSHGTGAAGTPRGGRSGGRRSYKVAVPQFERMWERHGTGAPAAAAPSVLWPYGAAPSEAARITSKGCSETCSWNSV